MNETPNAPVSLPEPVRPVSMFQTWIDAVTKPNERTFAAIASSPNAKYSTAFLWVLIGSIIQSLLTFLVQGTIIRQMLESQGLGNQLPQGGGLAGAAATIICGAPIAAVFSVLVFAVVVAIIQWVARMFGGHGTYDRLAYTFAAIYAPVSIISGLLVLLSAIPYVGFCFGILTFALSIYMIVLQVMATKVVNGFGWGPAAGSVLIPGIVVGILCCCLAFGVASLLGLAVGNVFSQLGPLPFPTP